MMASSAITTPPATIHAVRSERPVAGVGAIIRVPASGAPHRWQNRACADTSAPQAAQVRGPSAVPQALQNFPCAGWPQPGQLTMGSGMGGM
jgi:hypothetical protein